MQGGEIVIPVYSDRGTTQDRDQAFSLHIK